MMFYALVRKKIKIPWEKLKKHYGFYTWVSYTQDMKERYVFGESFEMAEKMVTFDQWGFLSQCLVDWLSFWNNLKSTAVTAEELQQFTGARKFEIEEVLKILHENDVIDCWVGVQLCTPVIYKNKERQTEFEQKFGMVLAGKTNIDFDEADEFVKRVLTAGLLVMQNPHRLDLFENYLARVRAIEEYFSTSKEEKEKMIKDYSLIKLELCEVKS